MNQEKPELNKAIAKQLSSFRVTENLMKRVIQKLSLEQDIMKWDRPILGKIATELRKATKPMIIACNKIDVKGADENFNKLKADFPDNIIVACSAESELALREAAKHEMIKYISGDNNFEILHIEKLNEKQKNALQFVKTEILEKYGSTGVQKVLDIAVFDLLKYKAIFPGGMSKLEDQYGRVLPDCFLLPSETTALDFAFKLHTDFGNNFVKAIDVKKRIPVGKDYVLQNLDVIEIKTSK